MSPSPKLIVLAASAFAFLTMGLGSAANAGKISCSMHNGPGMKANVENEKIAIGLHESYDKPLRCVSVDKQGRKSWVTVLYGGWFLTMKGVAVRNFSITCPWQDKISGSLYGVDAEAIFNFGVQGGVFASQHNGFCYLMGMDVAGLGGSVLFSEFQIYPDRVPKTY